MIEVIGKVNCNQCENVKTALKDKGIEFEYKDLKDLSDKEQEECLKMAQESKQMSLPLIIQNHKLVNLTDITEE